MAHDLTNFRLGEMLKCSLELRRIGRAQPHLEAAAKRICRFLYNELSGSDGQRACALVRCYKTHRFGALPRDLQRFARRSLPTPAGEAADTTDAVRCLTLVATAGDEDAWNERHLSSGHQAIPLVSPKMVERAPMIAQLIRQFGLDLADVVQPSPEVMRDLAGKTYGVFHVENATGSPYIPAQAPFVERYGIRSVLGFGGSLNGGDLFAVILFSRVVVTADVADRFRTLALDVKGVFLPFGEDAVFERRIIERPRA
jgi:hypothetical protein